VCFCVEAARSDGPRQGEVLAEGTASPFPTNRGLRSAGALCSTPQSLADAVTPTTRVLYSNAAKARKPLKFAGVPQTRQQISVVSRPKFTILWGHVEEVSMFNKFFSDCRYMPQLRRYSPTKLCDCAKMAIFASCIYSEPHAAHFRPAF